jgi:ATP-binding cassette, subfamily B, bacterial
MKNQFINKLPLVKAFNSLKVVPKAIKLLWEASPTDFLLVFTFNSIQGFAPPAAAFVAKLIIDHLVAKAGVTPALWWLVSCEFVIWAVWSIARYLTNAYQKSLRERLWNTLGLRVAKHAAQLDLEFFESPNNHNVLKKAIEELGYRPAQMTFALLSATQDLITVFGFLAVVIAFQPVLALVVILAFIPAMFAIRDSSFMSFQTYDMTTTLGRRVQYLDYLLMAEDPAKEVRLFNLAGTLLERRQQLSREIVRSRVQLAQQQAFRFAWGDVIALLFQYGSLAYVALKAATETITVGDFALLATALSRVRQHLAYALASFGDVLENSLFFNNLTTFLSLRPKIVSPDYPTPVPISSPLMLRFEGVTFAYPGASKPIFDNFNFELRAGEATALVGVNGAGKTTLVKLLTRLYDPTKGRITLNGIDIREFDVREYYALFGVILQDFTRYQLSALENVTIARNWANPDLTRAEKSALDSKAKEVIESFPEGWDTFLGRQFDDNGQNLSGGQWQRIALARALYRDAPILILDEPTAALDAEAEAEVFQSYHLLTAGRSSLLITHRLNTVKMADRIVVIEDGAVVEDGQHNELMNLKHRYYEMFTAQVKSYGIEYD